jgi:hypothetical protein
MATGNRTLKLSILADVDDLKKKLGEADKSVESNSKKISDFGKKAALAFAAVGAAAIVFAKKAIQAGEGAATANARIDQINKSMNLFGNSTNEVTQRLISYAEATARATGVDTNSIKITQAKLLTFKELAKSAGELGGEFDRATKAAIDLAAAGFGSAETNAVQLGKALQDPIKGLTALGRSGVTFTEVEKERIKTLVESNRVGEAQRLILEAIETQVGGTALATANASERIRVGFTQVQEKIGLALLPTFERFANYLLITVIPVIESFIAGLTNVGDSADQANQSAFEFGERVRSTAKFVVSIKDELLVLGGVIATVFVAGKIVAFVTAIGTLVTAMKALRTAAAGAAVATAFATGGTSVGAAALALTAVAATYGLSQFARGADETGTGGSSFEYGAGNPQFGLPTASGMGGSNFTGGGFTGGGFTGGTGTGGGKGVGSGGAITTQAATSLKDLADKLLNVQDRFSELTFQVASGGISKTVAQKQFDALEAQFRVLEKQGKTLAANPNIVINVSGAVDPEGTARAVANSLNSQAARSVTALRDRVN